MGHRLPPTVAIYTVPQPILVTLPPPPPQHRYVRVAGDILWAKQTLGEQIPGYSPWAFAVPFGDTSKSNDPRIPPFLDWFLGRQFRAVFLTWPPEYSETETNHARLPRIEIHRDTPTTRLYRWLRDRIPSKSRTQKETG